MKKRIVMFAIIVFVAGFFVSVSEAKVAIADAQSAIGAADHAQAMACGDEKCGTVKEDSGKTCPKKENCDKTDCKKKCCSESEAQKQGCSKSKGGCTKKPASGE